MKTLYSMHDFITKTRISYTAIAGSRKRSRILHARFLRILPTFPRYLNEKFI